MNSRIGTNGDITVSVDSGQSIGVHVGSGGLESLGRRAFTVGVAEGAAVTIDGDYRRMRNLPSINGVTIIGALSLEELSLRAVYYDTTANYDAQPDLISQEGALYLYSDYIDYEEDDGTRITIPGIRIGDGKTLLKDLQFAGGSSGSGTTNYNALRNKPSINGVTLEGQLELDDLSLKAVYYATKEAWAQQDNIIPPEGDIFIIADHSTQTDESGNIISRTPAIKIGDGVTELGALKEFVGYDAEKAKEDIVSYLLAQNALVSEADRTKWNRKRLKVEIDQFDEECLRFYYE